MKVSELFAEIGFKVDEKGLDSFSKKMKDVQSTIKSCVSELKDFAKAAEQINKAVQNIKTSYIPTQKEAAARFRAQTYYIRSAGKELRGRGIMEAGKGDYWGKRAELAGLDSDRLWRSLFVREENLRLRKEGNGGSGNMSYAVTIGTIIGNIVSSAIKGVLSLIKSMFSSAISMFKNTVREAMVYRDYRSFTGRSAKELSGLMAMTAVTSGMSPQDILRDAKDLQKRYWDIFYGKASPEAFLRLGVMPTGNGSVDLRNLLTKILSLSGNLSNRGVALSWLGQAGLSEQYMPILEKMSRGETIEDIYNIADSSIESLEKINEQMNKFSQEMQQLRIELVDNLWKAGLKDVLTYLFDRLVAIVSLLRGGAFKGKSFTESAGMIMDVLQDTSSKHVKYMKDTGIFVEPQNMTVFDNLKKTGEVVDRVFAGLALFPVSGLLSNTDFGRFSAENILSSDFKVEKEKLMRAQEIERQINNYYIDAKGRSAQETATIVGEARDGSINQMDINDTSIMTRALFSGGY